MGHVAVKLAEPIVPGAVTIDHISPLISPDISSAPKEFTVKVNLLLRQRQYVQ